MGYSDYPLADGRRGGYGVEADCDYPGCEVRINRGMGYLCGPNPLGHKDAEEAGCGNYYCSAHEFDHACTDPECGLFPADEGMSCQKVEGHEPPCRSEDGEFTAVERPALQPVPGEVQP